MWKKLLCLFLLLISSVVTTTRPLHAQDCSDLFPRPTLSGEEYTRETNDYVIHYTDEGADAATEEHIDKIQSTLDEVFEFQSGYLGWPMPPLDCGEGGDQRYDIYVYDSLSKNATGYAMPEGYVSEEDGGIGISAAYSYLALDNDFVGLDDLDSTLSAVVAHEAFHSIQFVFDSAEPADWYYEASAVYMANITYPDLEDLASFALLLETPELCLGFQTEDEALSSRVYGEWVYFENLVDEAGGDPTIVLDLWRNIALYDGMESLYITLEEYGLDPVDVHLSYVVRNLLRDYRAGSAMVEAGDYVWEESDIITGLGEYTPDGEGLQQLGVNYVPISELGLYSFWLDEENLSLAVVGITETALTAEVYVPFNGESVDTSSYDYAYVLVLNSTLHANHDECIFTPWVLTVEEGNPDNLAGLIETVFDSSNFFTILEE